VQKEKRNKILRTLTLVGCFSTGIIYSAIGVIALLSFFRLKEGGADESSFFVLLDNFIAGRILNWIIILGALCFIAWRFYEAFADPYGMGSDGKGILLRTGAAFSSAADGFIALSVLTVTFGRQAVPVNGEPLQQRNMVGHLLEWQWGHVLVFTVGAIILVTAAVLILYGLSKSFTESIKATDFSKKEKYIVHGIAYAGYFSRGVILAIIGFFYVESSIKNDSSLIVNTDKAFNFIGEHVGHPWFILIAIGTVSYGVYMFILGLHYDVRGDKKS
jgi:hypothetical protein